MSSTPQAPPASIVIFGASGDLASRKLLPALRELSDQGMLHPCTRLIGVGRSELTDDAWQDLVGHPVLCRDSRWVTGDYTDPATYERLGQRLVEADEAGCAGNRLFYLSVPPDLFCPIARCLGEEGLDSSGHGGEFTRIVIEKPFGTDRASARELDDGLHAVFDESQLFRIDHYLGKETVQNVLALRFANAIFEPLWNRNYVDSVQLTVAEDTGVGHRAGFYDQAGALRDIVQNHALQVLALTAMEGPAAMTADGIRDEKVKVLNAVHSVSAPDAVRGRYAGYAGTDDVPASSTTETYVAMRLHIDNWRWAGVPFYLRTGKRLAHRATEVVLRFRSAPHLPFAPQQVDTLEPNQLILRIQPDEGICLTFGAKEPGPAFEVGTVAMEMTWAEEFAEHPADAYERLLYDALVGDATLFIRADEVDAAWRIVEPLLDAWGSTEPPDEYEPGSWGPACADELLAHDGRSWHTP